VINKISLVFSKSFTIGQKLRKSKQATVVVIVNTDVIGDKIGEEEVYRQNLNLKKATDETDCAIMSPVRGALMQLPLRMRMQRMSVCEGGLSCDQSAQENAKSPYSPSHQEFQLLRSGYKGRGKVAKEIVL
jgi:hypothetical protein